MNFPIQNNANVASNTFTGTVISVDSSIKQGCGHAVTSLVIQKNHGQLLVESAHHSYTLIESLYIMHKNLKFC